MPLIYAWTATGTAPDGAAFSTFLATLNNGISTDTTTISGCFAGYCGWRLPTTVELQTILLDPYSCDTDPCIDPTFGPTQSFYYWSATATNNPSRAWGVDFVDGNAVFHALKTTTLPVRAVRGRLVIH